MNQARYNVLYKTMESRKKALNVHNQRRNALVAITVFFFLLMIVAISAGFIFDLGNGAAGISIVTILFFTASATLTGIWIWKGWNEQLQEYYEEAQQEFNEFMVEEGSK